MARRKRRSAFPETGADRIPEPHVETILADDPSPGLFGFFRSLGVRETIESLIIAIVLALLFRAYEAEAFIIPTGSMAPSLNGQHVDLACEHCGFQYHAGASGEADQGGENGFVRATRCPICRYQTQLRRVALSSPRPEPDHESNNGDRILVNKFIYDFSEPQRYDVIVFKNPNNGKQNYIKRLIGLPGDNILIENGDVYLMEFKEGQWVKEITRKPPRKLRHILQTVDDTHFIGPKLELVKWPSRWQAFSDGSSWEIDTEGEYPTFQPAEQAESWLRYRHYQPWVSEWPTIENGSLPGRFRDGKLPKGELIGDLYGYNESSVSSLEFNEPLGLNWVGDIGLECWVDVREGNGELMFDVVEGGAHFLCTIDIATGQATLTVDDSAVATKVTFTNANGEKVDNPTATTNLKGVGNYQVQYVNADDQIHLWINNRYIEFDAATYNRSGIPIPTYAESDPGDAEPLGVGVKGAEIEINRLKVVRDIYYVSVKGADATSFDLAVECGINPDQLRALNRTPEAWSTPQAQQVYGIKKGQDRPMFELVDHENSALDQFLPMGDNSPRSSDGRVWNGPNYVERNLLIGRAMFVYWPHTLNSPPYFPNFGEMGFIR